VSRAHPTRDPWTRQVYQSALIVFASFLMFISVVPQVSPTHELIVAASSAPATTVPTSASGSDIAGALSQAKADWLAVAPTADLSGVTASGSDLGGLQLASTSGRSITVDMDAAGWGWSVNFAGESGHMSLVTVIRHELGHVLGLDHASGLMSSTLSADQTRSVTASDAEPLTPAPVETTTTEAVSEPVTEPTSESVMTEPDSEPVTEPSSDPVTGESDPEPDVPDTGSEPGASDAVPILEVSASSLDAGGVTVGESSTVFVDVSNTGTAALVISDISISGDAAFTTSVSGMTLEPGEAVAVSVDFVPNVTGPVSATLDITSDGGGASVTLSGAGAASEPADTDPTAEPVVTEPVSEPVASDAAGVLVASVTALDAGTVALGGLSTVMVDL